MVDDERADGLAGPQVPMSACDACTRVHTDSFHVYIHVYIHTDALIAGGTCLYTCLHTRM